MTEARLAHRTAFRSALGRFATGVTVVTARSAADTLVGLTISSFNAVSLEPPLILWSLSRASGSLSAVRSAAGFVVNVLSAKQADLAMTFARGGGPSPYGGGDWSPAASGAPILKDTLAHFECVHHAEHDGGDHVIFVGRVVRFAAASGDPLIFSFGRFARAGELIQL